MSNFLQHLKAHKASGGRGYCETQKVSLSSSKGQQPADTCPFISLIPWLLNNLQF